MNIKTIQTGYTLVSPAVPDRSSRKSPIAYTGMFQRRSRRIKVPVKCFYVEVKGHHLLIDAGWSKQVISNPRKHLGRVLYFCSTPEMKEEEAACNQLAGMQLEGIYMTHLDCDHVSGLQDFNNLPIWTAHAEIDGVKKARLRYGCLTEGIELSALAFQKDPKAIFGYSCDVFQDGSVTAYLTPTHSAGSVIYQVSEGGKYALLVGDNGYNGNSWEKDLLPGPLYHAGNMHKCLHWINQCAQDPRCVGIFCAHDPILKNYEETGEYL